MILKIEMTNNIKIGYNNMRKTESKDTVPGLIYYLNYLSEEEEKEFLTLLNESKDLESVNHAKDGGRKVIQYGYIYSYDRSGITKTKPIPEIYKKLIDPERLKRLEIKYDFDQLIINRYMPGEGITGQYFFVNKNILAPASMLIQNILMILFFAFQLDLMYLLDFLPRILCTKLFNK